MSAFWFELTETVLSSSRHMPCRLVGRPRILFANVLWNLLEFAITIAGLAGHALET
jgi:hypothetical protein